MKEKRKGMASGALGRRDQAPKVTTKGKSYGSGLNESKKNVMKEYTTGALQRNQVFQSDNTNPRSRAEGMSNHRGFGHTFTDMIRRAS